jgi:hypothetical protein
VVRLGLGIALAFLVSAGLAACGGGEDRPRPPGPLADTLAEIGGGGEHGSLGVGWTEPQLAREAGVGRRLMADALGPNAESVVEVGPTLERRFRFDPLSAERLVSVGGSYAFGLRADGIDGSSVRDALMRAGGHAKENDEGVDLVDVGPYAQVPEPLLRSGVFGLGARDAFPTHSTVLAISANSRAALLGRGGRLIDQPIYRAAADCLGDVVAARMVPERLLLSVEVGIDLVAAGIQRDREVLCVLGGTQEGADRTAASLRRSLAPDARDPRTGDPLSELVEPGAEVETSTYEGTTVVRAEVTPVAGRRGFFFGTIARGSLVQMISAR